MEDSPHRGWALEEWTLGAATAVNVLLALAVAHFPYQDSINHLTRYFLMDLAWSGHPVDWVQVRLVPTSYIGTDAVGVALVHLFGATATLRVMAVLPLVLLPAGMYALQRVTAPSQRGWALVGALLSLSWFYLGGFLSYTVGFGLTLFWLAAWWPRRAECSWRCRILLAAGCIVLFLLHLSAPLVVLVVVGLDLILTAASARLGDREMRRTLPSRVVTLGVITVGVALVWGLTQAASEEVRSVVAPPVFRTPIAKVMHLAAPFYSFSMLQMAVMGGAYLLAAAALAVHIRREAWSDPFLLSGLAFLVLYLCFPSRASAAGDVDTRWLLPAYLLPFCMVGRRRPPVAALLLIFGLCLVHAGIIRWYSVGIDRELMEFDRALERLPAKTRVLPLVSDQARHGHVSPYLHFALWHTIRKQGRVPGLFSANGTRDSDPAYPHFNHFRVSVHSYLPDAGWGVRTWERLDCRRIRQEYDYVLQAGADARATSLIQRCAIEDFRVGEVTVYRVPTP